MALASAFAARLAAGASAAGAVGFGVLIVGCSGASSGTQTPTPTDARPSDVQERDGARKDAGVKEGGRRDVREAGDGAHVHADGSAHSDASAYSDAHGHSDADAYSDAHGHGDADAYSDAHGYGDADAEPANTFDGALWINPGTCGLGEIGATFRGIPAYCQPSSAIGFYQCDELANRFMRDALQHPDLDNVVTENASSICEYASTMAAYSVWGPGYGDTTGRAPVAGDLIVLPGIPGHVTVVVGFSSATEVTVMQQNAGPSTTSFVWDPASSFVVGAECWVHAESAPPAELPDASACGCFTTGATCGLAIVDHEWWYGCNVTAPEGGVQYGSLYSCDGGAYAKTADCPALCITPSLFDAVGYCGT